MSARSGLSSVDKISDCLMERLEKTSSTTKRPTSPIEGDTPCKKPHLHDDAQSLLPESAHPIFHVSMFGIAPVAESSSSAKMNETEDAASSSGVANTGTDSHSDTSPTRSTKSPLEAALDSIRHPLKIKTEYSSVASGPSTNVTHDESPSDSEESDDHVNTEEAIVASNDSLSPFLQSILSGQRKVSDADIFCSVPGRLSLLSQASKYQVSVGEIRRRLSTPECLNASLMGGILRRAKSKNGGTVLRNAIQAVGMELPVGRRKSLRVSLFTSLVEGEAAQLSKDFHTLCGSEFPVKELALLSQEEMRVEEQRRLHQINAATELMTEFLSLMDRSQRQDATSTTMLHVKEGMTHFDLATHGFGSDAVQTGCNQFLRFMELQKKMMENPMFAMQQRGSLMSPSSTATTATPSHSSSAAPSALTSPRFTSNLPPQSSPRVSSRRPSSPSARLPPPTAAVSMMSSPFLPPTVPLSSSSSFPSPLPHLPKPEPINPVQDLSSSLQAILNNPSFFMALLQEQQRRLLAPS